MNWHGWLLTLCGTLLLATLPASTNYQLNSYGVGSGGTAGSSSTNYQANGITGEQSGSGSSTNYSVGAGENYLKEANVPEATLTNLGDWYDKLQIVIDPQGNPSDATFAVAISTDNFATVTDYVQSDFTVGTTLTSSNFLTYAAWGSATGATIRGLTPSTVYSVKVTASRGTFTQSGFGPVVTASTAVPGITFGIGIGTTYTLGSPPYVLNMGNLLGGSVVTATNKIWLTLNTNADNGALIFGQGQNGGLNSAATGHMIPTVTTSADLATLPEGFGEQDSSVTQAFGGPLFNMPPFNVTGTNVGQDYTNLEEMFGTSSPITSGVGSISLLGKSSTQDPASSDYTETLTEVAAESF